ncbi:predicted protein [Lichtheimia corymbifera JMRC:FSU:9682]|uniref:Heterokaryon incompatibility domain-containing protein n=1 Tax=Lichtheimia corymbifera JMRC:FSU:9682 TaxID=1263082 RepID=A0A068RS38_9FUNG|nr:predicted protein [Lichtheimia corymbifera JMRC:FSU:9682]
MTVTSTSKDPPADTEFGKLWTLEDTFSDKDFRLLYVPPKNEQGIMTIITPSKHEPSYVPDRKFHALSHLWGTDPKDNLWEVGDFISDEDGITVDPIPMREEKRDTFLKLLQENPGYWWIDVLCCRTDTPPVIMRGVYGCCHTCFAMIDCPSKAIEYFSVVLAQFKVYYEETGPINGCSYMRPRCNLPPLHDPISTLREGWKHARDIWECRWFSRVWTMQELALPSTVMLLSETCGGIPCYVSAGSLERQLSDFKIIFGVHQLKMGDEVKILDDLQYHLMILRDADRNFHKSDAQTTGGELDDFTLLLDQFATSERSCYYAEDYVYGVLGILGCDIPRLNDMEDLWDRFLFSLQRIAEKALCKSLAYNLFNIVKIDRGEEYETCLETVAKHFQETIQLDITEEARSCVLSEACNMSDIYQGLLCLKVDCSCPNCGRFLEMFDESLAPFKV